LKRPRPLSYVSLELRVQPTHPLRGIKELLDEALAGMSREFDRVYAAEGRPSDIANPPSDSLAPRTPGTHDLAPIAARVRAWWERAGRVYPEATKKA